MQPVLLCGSEGKFMSKFVFVGLWSPVSRLLSVFYVHNTYNVITEPLKYDWQVLLNQTQPNLYFNLFI